MKNKPFFSLIPLLLLSCAQASSQAKKELFPAAIRAVVDGDTIDVTFQNTPPEDLAQTERVRLIGVNTPELFSSPPDFYAAEARDYVNQFWRSNVSLRFDTVSARRDVYGRLLAYVFLPDGSLLNEALIRLGFGRYYDAFPFENTFMRRFKEAERLAREEERGLWEILDGAAEEGE